MLTNQPQPWRPLSIVPGMTWNAASSLVVPLAVFVLMAGLSDRERRWLPGILLVVITASMLLGLLQFSGAGFENPLINDSPGLVSGMFANRNHLALFLALGCLIAPVWAFPVDGRAGLRPLVALGLTALFVLTILATGSRTGMALGILTLIVGPLSVQREIRRMLHGRARWILPAIVVALLVAVGGLILLSLVAGRAASIDRVFSVDAGQDMRRLGLPTVWDMVREYFPWGTGIGGFDNLFRMHEPFDLLKLSYFNHAHDDFLEIALDAGLPGLALLLAVIVWGVVAAIRAWRSPSGCSQAKLASLMLLVICIASVVDYPARTPMIMAMIVISGIWLSHTGPRRGEPALPQSS
ncbi:MAG: O-antigen ligase domain-containing protein [Oxalobacteraceae bacterium]|nr:MAG: O-antigen ligase domain-containing protein [Oxalobacteraceae bacterium]